MFVAETQGEKGDSTPKIALLNALREASLTQTGRKGRGAGIGDGMYIVHWSPALIHVVIVLG